MTIEFTPKGTCSRKMTVSAEDGVITGVEVVGGCEGNLKGVAALLKGMRLDDAIERMRGIECGKKGTSCPDQLSYAMQALLDKQA